MSLPSGTRLGPYEILAPLGAGGMGEVYKATDTRLDRAVALKVISSLAANDPDLRQRFEREARTVSQLSHPHICALFDVGHDRDVDYLVMELIEGETLSDRLARGPLPVDQALRAAVEIAEALSAAHRRGIVHRDLKPGNVMLTKAGSKLLDFGLAKLAGPAMPASVAAMPTTPANLTAQGTILGTFQYMSPEQLEGREADARSDIFAFGALLYEMLTGRRAFEAKSQAGLISAIMTAEPPRVTSLQPLAPAGVDYAVTRCLAKDPDDRWQSARDLAAELRRVAAASHVAVEAPISSSGQAVVAVSPTRRVPAAWIVAAVAIAAALGVSAWAALSFRDTPPPQRLHLAIPLLPADNLDSLFAFSPDGTRLAFVAQREGRPQVFVRALDRPQAVAIASPASISNGGPTFSPDGKWLVFAGSTRLWKVSVDGGAPVMLSAQVNSATGRPTWAADGTIVFEDYLRGLSRIRAEGGEPQVLTQPAAGEMNHFAPCLTRDGRTLLYVIRRADSNFDSGLQLVARSMATGEQKVLLDGTDPSYLESGHLVFARSGTVFIAPFDAAGLRLTGDPVPVIEGVASQLGTSLFAAAQNGNVAYLSATDGGVGEGHLALVGPTGVATPLKLPPRRYADPRLSPDGDRVAVHTFEEGRDNYIADLKRGTLMRLTFDPGEDETPIWSPDGKSVVYTSTRTNVARAIYRKNADGTGTEEQLWAGKGHVHLGSFTPDGRTIVLTVAEEQQPQLATFTLGEKALKPLQASGFSTTTPTLSPDGRWLAYVSDETGRSEVYVQPFPKMDGRWPISTNGGREPVWSRNGRQLFYRTAGKLMAVQIAGGDTFVASAPAQLFEDHFLATMGDTHTCLDAAPDGQLLMVSRSDGSTRAPSHVSIVLGLLSNPAAVRAARP